MNRCPSCGFESESQYCPNCGQPTMPMQMPSYSQPMMGGNSPYGAAPSGGSLLSRLQSIDGWNTWIRIFLILCIVYFAWTTFAGFTSWINGIIIANQPYSSVNFATVVGWISSLISIAKHVGALVGSIVALTGKSWGGWLLFICWFLIV